MLQIYQTSPVNHTASCFSSWACKFLWLNNCTVNYFHMCSQRAHLKRWNPSLALPHGQLDGDGDPALWEAGWGTLQPYSCLCFGTGVWARAAWWQRHLWLSLILLCPTLWASGCCGRLPQDLILMELWNRARGGSPGAVRCVLGCSLHSPTTLMRKETALIFLLRGCGQICSKRSNALRGELRAAGPARAGPQGPWGAGRARHDRAVSARAGTPRLRRRRRSVFASAAAASGPLAAGQLLMFPLALVRRGIQENNRQRWGLSRSGGAGQRSPARRPATSALGLRDGRCSGDYFEIKSPGAMGIKSVREAGRRLPKMSAVPRKSYRTQTKKDRNAQITCRLHCLGHGSNKREHKETLQVPPCTATTIPIVMEPARCWECPFPALGLPETLQGPDFPCRSEPAGRAGHKQAVTCSWRRGNSVWAGQTPVLTSPR